MDVRSKIRELAPWFHNLHLPDGTQTYPEHPFGDFPQSQWLQLAPHLPGDLNGQTVLDIGCNAGFYSIELAQRGAIVTAIDVDEHYLAQARWAAEVFGLSHRIHLEQRQIYSLAKDGQRWDMVLFLGVLYHLRYPMLGLDIAARCVGRTLILQSLTAPGDEIEEPPEDLSLAEREPLVRPGWPRLSFIERNLAGDCTNWWAPNRACIEAMVRSSGLRIVGRPCNEFYICQPDAGLPSNMWRWNEDEYWAAVGQPSPSAR